MIDSLVESVETYCREHQLISHDDRLVLAVSGGLDSVMLLHIFLQLQGLYSIDLAVLHVNHQIRGAAGDADEAFVAKLATKNKLPFYAKQVDVPAYRDQNKLSMEESARACRYRMFEETLAETGYDKLATAHTANDQAETVLDHLLRGSGIRGMRGILSHRDRYIRPLLNCKRDALLDCARQAGIDFRHDETNSDLSYKRNRIRHELLPALAKQYNPLIVDTLNRSAKLFSETESYLESQAAEAYKSLVFLQKKNEIVLEIEAFLSYFYVIQKYVLLHAAAVLGVDRNRFDSKWLNSAIEIISRKQTGSKSVLFSDMEVMLDHDGLVIRRPGMGETGKQEIVCRSDGEARFAGYKISWHRIGVDEIDFSLGERIAFLDYEKTGASLFLRTAKPGDRFVPLNLKGSKKVSDYLSDRKVPLRYREKIPILETSNEIVWISGYRIDDRFKIRENTRNVLRFEINEVADDV